jgi:molybdopterin synthase catalytic subunit
MSVRVQEADFDLNAELTALRAGDPRIGALASFVGLVRDINDGAGVSEMTLEHYPGMTEKALAAIVDEAKARWTSTARWSSTASARSSPATRSSWSP